MTDFPPDTAALVKRRLTGLVVLLLLAFLLGLLQHQQNETLAPGLQSVVIPLDGNASAPAMATAPEEESAAAAIPDKDEAALLPAEEPTQAVAAAPVAMPPLEKPVVKAPITDKPKASEPSQTRIKPVTAPRWYVAVGSFKGEASARAVEQRIRQAGFKVETRPITSAGVRLTRVLAGPFSTADKAEIARATLIVEGLTKATILAEK